MKKLIALLLAAAMSLGMAACTSNGDTKTTDPEKTDPQKEVEKKTIVYWSQWSENETQADVFKNAISRFEANNPEYKVEVNWAGRDVRQILRATIDSGQAIDIVESGFDMIVSQLGEEYLTDVTQYMKGTEFEAAITPSMVNFAKSFTSSGDSWYYIPSQPFVGTIYYNKEIFDQAGIETLPTNWDEFMQCCEKIKNAGFSPITSDDAYLEQVYSAYIGSVLGTEAVTEMMNDPSSELWNDPVILQMGKDFEAMAEQGYLTEGSGSFVFPSAQNTEFAMGTTAMYYNGSWFPNEISPITGDDFQWGAMFFPSPANATLPNTTYATGCQFFAIPRTSKNPEGAVKLLAEFTSPETQKELLEKCESIPVIDGLDLPENLKCCGTIMSEATNAVPWGYGIATTGDVKAVVTASFSKLIAGEISAEEFVAELDAQLK